MNFKNNFREREQSVRSPLKPGINPTIRGIVVQVRIFGLKRAKMPFSARKPFKNRHFKANT